MTLAGRQIVFGFGSGLDWRPTLFVDPFPPTRVCSTCGLVPSSAATLPCSHFLCQPCYDRSAGKRGQCPLDNAPFQEEDVGWSTFSEDSILSRKLRCWNSEHGCDVEDTASAMLEHFAKACQFHTVYCPKCGNNLLHRDIARHLDIGCTAACSREQPLDDNFSNAFLEVRELLGKILEENSALHRKFDAIEESYAEQTNRAIKTSSSITVDSLVDALQKRRCSCGFWTQIAFARFRSQFSAQIRVFLADVERTMEEVITEKSNRIILTLKGNVAEDLSGERSNDAAAPDPANTSSCRLSFDVSGKEEKILKTLCDQNTPTGEHVASVPGLLAVSSPGVTNTLLNVSKPQELTVEDWSSVSSRAAPPSEYRSDIDGHPQYYYGYLTTPEIWFNTYSDVVNVRLLVMRGMYDDSLEWPMKKTFRLRFVHPRDSSKDLTLSWRVHWHRNKGHFVGVTREALYVGVCSDYIRFRSLEVGGFVEDNKLRLRVDFVP